MGRQKGSELFTGRNLAVAGGLLGASAAAGFGVSRLLRARAGRPDLALVWGGDPFEPDVERQVAEMAGFTGKEFKHHLAVVETDAGPFDEHLSRSEGMPAMAVRGQNGLWYAGFLAGNGEFGLLERGESPKVRAVALAVGNEALQAVQLGVMDEARFVPFDTSALDIEPARGARHAYPDVPLIALPPMNMLIETPDIS